MSRRSEPFEAIETTRLRLRLPRRDDVAALSGMVTPAVSQGLGAWPVPFTPGMALERIETALASHAEGTAVPCLIEGRSAATALGWIAAVRSTTDIDRAILSYWLGEANHGRGFMREAVSAFLEPAFGHLGVAVLQASTHPGNAASIKVLRACGMIPIGECMIFAPARGREERCLLFELSRSDRDGDTTGRRATGTEWRS